jgi:diguanylate cyclase (GGDEF)-like protein/PAS domain S-box-containing protein
MSSGGGSAEDSQIAELSVLIKALRETDQRLEELTHGEIDTVADREGRSFLLHRAQGQLRYTEAAKQAAILNALPAHIVLLDTQGIILSANDAWSKFPTSSVLLDGRYAVGFNYLERCENAKGKGAADAHKVAAGIRSVLQGEQADFSIEYSCQTLTGPRRFLLTVTPLTDDRPKGAVVMHVDVTAERQTEENLRLSESRFRQMAKYISDVFFLQNLDGSQIFYVSPAYEKIWGRTCESLCANPSAWVDSIHPDDRATVVEELRRRRKTGFEYEFRIIRPDGDIRSVHTRGFPILDDDGNAYRTAGVVTDVTERNLVALDLRESERRFGDLLQNVDLASVMLDRDARITYCNEYFLRLSGWRLEEVLGKDWFELFTVSQPSSACDFFALLSAASPAMRSRETELITRSGERRLMRWNNSVLRSGDGPVIGSASIGEDITERKQAEARIAYLNRVYAMLSGINTLIVRVRDRHELFKEACQIAVEVGGFRISVIGTVDPGTMRLVPVALAGKDEKTVVAVKGILSRVDAAPTPLVTQAISEKKAVVSNDSQHDPRAVFGERQVEFAIQSIAVFPLLVSGEAIGVLALYAGESDFFHAEEIELLSGLTRDIAFAIDHIEKQERLDYLAYYDVLTGLANRNLFLERVAQYMRGATSAGHKLALFMIDLERFKNINDSFGQAAGDSVLRQSAKWLTDYVGDASLVTRVSADRFAVVLPKVQQDGDLAGLIENTNAAFLNHPFQMNGAVLRIAAKVGVALYPDDAADADTLFKHAEAALKKAKASGDRYLFYTQKMTDMVAGKLSLENHLRQALENEEFVLHYQPKVDLSTGAVMGAEALIRWNDPRTGLVAPDRFIPILEETGLIYEVGRWALRMAIEDYLRWRSEGLAAVRIAVNVSPLQLRNRGFLAQIEQAIAVDPHAAAGLELEITESLIMDDVKHNITTLQAIRDMGVTLAIDDFGTGFSSLSYLAKLPLHTLKIDRSFIVDMAVGMEGLALVSAIIILAHSLKLKVVAEGVETEEQSGLLRMLKCDEMQGYLFSKPVAADIFQTRFLTQAI